MKEEKEVDTTEKCKSEAVVFFFERHVFFELNETSIRNHGDRDGTYT